MTTPFVRGSYTVRDDPWDDFQSTIVPLHTPHGPVTLHFLHGSEVFMVSGYETGEYRGGQAYANTEDEAFTWKGAEIIGSQNFRLDGGAWRPLTNRNYPGQGYGTLHFSARKGRNVTDKMARDIAVCWAEIIGHYAAGHPRIPAHAQLRRVVKVLTDTEAALDEIERQLAELREARTTARQAVRSAFTSERITSEPDVTCWPLPYSRETANGYVAELENDPELARTITELRAEKTS
jgi:hypothetical protein